MVQNIEHDDREDSDDKDDMPTRASRSPSDVASVNSETQQQQNECDSTANSAEYDPSIWDFLSTAQRDDDEEEEEDDDNDDVDADDDADGDGDGTQVRLLTSREVDMRPIKHAKAVLEIVDTEISYGNDLAIIKRVRNVNEWTTVLIFYQGENCRGKGGWGLNPPVILSTPQLMLLEVPQGVGHNPQQWQM